MSVGALSHCPRTRPDRLHLRRSGEPPHMATARTSFPRPNLLPRPLRTARRFVLVLTGTIAVSAGVALVPPAASAAPDAPGPSQGAAALMAARAHDLEAVTEQFNTARDALAGQQAAAKAA